MSKAWDLRTLQQSFTSSKVSPAYTVIGEDAYLVQEAVVSIKNHFEDLGVNFDFNFECLYFSEKKAADVVDVIETLPMMSPYRLVLIKEAHLIKEKDWDLLKKSIEKGLDHTVVVFIHEAKFDKRKKIYKWISSQTQLVELVTPYENQVPVWIHYMAQKNGLSLDQGAALQLLHLVGVDLTEINNEILKLKNYYQDQKTKLVIDDILKVVSKKRIESVFDLTACVASGNKPQSLQLLTDLIDQGQNEVGVISLISRHMRILKKILEHSNLGLSQKQLSAKIGVSPFFINQYLEQSRKWNLDKMNTVFDLLLDTDKALKTSPLSSKIWLENFVIQTCMLAQSVSSPGSSRVSYGL
jgi:DNA polymerase III subunit delta